MSEQEPIEVLGRKMELWRDDGGSLEHGSPTVSYPPCYMSIVCVCVKKGGSIEHLSRRQLVSRTGICRSAPRQG